MTRGRKDESEVATFVRFMSKVETPDTPGACWTWLGSKPRGRYGHFALDGGSVKAHRWIYELLNGQIPDGLVVRHQCDNPNCVNPAHLLVGTHADNANDKVVRGRCANRQGEKHPLAKLTDDDVREIRRLSSVGLTQHALAARYGVRRGQIGKIVQRINWKHVA